MKLPANTKNIRNNPFDSKEFNDTVAGLPIESLFDFEARKERALYNFRAYPSWLKKRHVHKVILSFKDGHTGVLDGPNGDRNQYIVFSAYHISVVYDRLLCGDYFPIIFPYRTFINMIETNLFKKIEQLKGQLVEIHFKKMNRQRYDVLFCAQVTQKEAHRFQREHIYLQTKNYNPEV